MQLLVCRRNNHTSYEEDRILLASCLFLQVLPSQGFHFLGDVSSVQCIKGVECQWKITYTYEIQNAYSKQGEGGG